jgi:hypothetical protein
VRLLDKETGGRIRQGSPCSLSPALCLLTCLESLAPSPPDWWDYTTLDAELIDEAAAVTARELVRLRARASRWSCPLRSDAGRTR